MARHFRDLVQCMNRTLRKGTWLDEHDVWLASALDRATFKATLRRLMWVSFLCVKHTNPKATSASFLWRKKPNSDVLEFIRSDGSVDQFYAEHTSPWRMMYRLLGFLGHLLQHDKWMCETTVFRWAITYQPFPLDGASPARVFTTEMDHVAAWDVCGNETGPGQLKRMRFHGKRYWRLDEKPMPEFIMDESTEFANMIVPSDEAFLDTTGLIPPPPREPVDNKKKRKVATTDGLALP